MTDLTKYDPNRDVARRHALEFVGKHDEPSFGGWVGDVCRALLTALEEIEHLEERLEESKGLRREMKADLAACNSMNMHADRERDEMKRERDDAREQLRAISQVLHFEDVTPRSPEIVIGQIRDILFKYHLQRIKTYVKDKGDE